MQAAPVLRLGLRHLALALLLTLLLGAQSFAPPAIDGRVTDPGSLLPATSERTLESRLAAIGRAHGDEVAVLVVASLDGASIEDAAYATFNAWKLGKKGRDNGVLLLIAPPERRIRIETGRGIGDRLTDATSSQIIRDLIAPRVRDNDLAGAVTQGVDAIAAVLDGRSVPRPLPAADATSPAPGSSDGSAGSPGSPAPTAPARAPRQPPRPDWTSPGRGGDPRV